MKKGMIIGILVLLSLIIVLSGCETIGEAKGGNSRGGKGKCTSNGLECGDCIDNDGDTLIDYKINRKGKVTGDTDCESLTDDSESRVSCGDLYCNGDETCETCPGDCGVCPECYTDSDCGTSTSNTFCSGNNACTNSTTYTCKNSGSSEATCLVSGGGGCGPCTYGCSDGNCIPASAITCSVDLDCGAPTSDTFCAGDYSCTNSTTPICKYPGTPESFCSVSGGGGCGACTYGCSDGACIPVNQSITCSVDLDCGAPTSNTFCAGDSLCSNQTTPICINPGEPESSCSISGGGNCGPCTYGCSDGACLTGQTDDSCVDSDNGHNYGEMGVAIGYESNDLYNVSDVCLTDQMLTEQYCEGNYRKSITVACINVTGTYCADGRCYGPW